MSHIGVNGIYHEFTRKYVNFSFVILTLLSCSYNTVVLHILFVKQKYKSWCTIISEFSLSCRMLSLCHMHSSLYVVTHGCLMKIVGIQVKSPVWKSGFNEHKGLLLN